MNKFMKLAIEEAMIGIINGDGGPFGSVIVKDGEVIAKGHNLVLKNKDATCHGEITAIREASKKLNTFNLKGTELYTTGEPCPMCLSACLWANIDKVYYGCSIADNEMIGFRDKKFDNLFGGRKAFDKYLTQIDRDECLNVFKEYLKMNHKIY